MSEPLLSFNAHDIRTDGIEVNAVLPASWLTELLKDTDLRPLEGTTELGHVRGRLSRSGNDIVVRARLRVSVEIPCARCLDPAIQNIATQLSLLLEPRIRNDRRGSRGGGSGGSGGGGSGGSGGRGGGHGAAGRNGEEEREFSAEEADLDFYDGERVVLDKFVRDVILLEVPTFPLCQESCPGLNASEPVALPAEARDPRLAPLNAFMAEGSGPATIDDLVSAAAARSTAMGRKPVLRSNQAAPRKKRRGKNAGPSEPGQGGPDGS